MTDSFAVFTQFVKDLILEKTDDAMPLERGLAAHREVQAKKVKKMGDTAIDVRELAYEMADNLAKEKIVLAELNDAAKKQRAKSKTLEEAKKDVKYVRLCDEIDRSEKDIAGMETEVAESFSDSQEAIAMINEQTDNLARIARDDNRMVRKEKMLTIEEQQQKMREEILRVFPEDKSDYRERKAAGLDKRARHLSAHKDVVDALWAHQHPAGEATEATSDGAQSVMDRIEKSL